MLLQALAVSFPKLLVVYFHFVKGQLLDYGIDQEKKWNEEKY